MEKGWMDTHFKKEDPHEKGNYRPITVQVAVNKLFEQLLSKQLSYGFNNKLCDKLTAYRKNNNGLWSRSAAIVDFFPQHHKL